MVPPRCERQERNASAKRIFMRLSVLALTTTLAWEPAIAHAQEDPDARAARIEAQMTDDERFTLISGIMPLPVPGLEVDIPEGVPVVAGYTPGIPRLGIPALLQSDASLGVTNPMQLRPGDVATAMPSGLALAASFDPTMAQWVGETIGSEVRAKGFNVLLNGGLNLTVDPRNGRNFEYLGEDPLLSGVLAGHAVKGVQSQGVVSTVKHLAGNWQETQRHTADTQLSEAALREGELLAFEIAIETGNPGSVMCAYNLVAGAKACGSDFLLNKVLKQDWGFKGWAMSDWGAVNDVSFFMNGLDVQSGRQLDSEFWFGPPLKAAIEHGEVPRARLSEAVRRILRSLYAVGIEHPYEPQPIDYDAHAEVALEAARQGIVLLKNDSVLPIAQSAKSILLVGGDADFGVLSGGGSSQVTPSNGAPRVIVSDGDEATAFFRRRVIFPGSPLEALAAQYPDTTVSYLPNDSAELATAAASADIVVFFATKWQGEGSDTPSLALPDGQDETISLLAKANPNTVVVLETGNPVTMPWLDQVKGVLAAWYPGQEGGEAIADVLSGKVNPSGHLPITFPRAIPPYLPQELPGFALPDLTRVEVNYDRMGSDIGYRYFAKSGETPLFPFGHGLSYTSFHHGGLTIKGSENPIATFTVTNSGSRAGADVAQLYLVSRNGERRQRLVGFARVNLERGTSSTQQVAIDKRLLADFREGGWHMPAGRYEFALGHSAMELGPVVSVQLPEARLEP